MLTMGRTHSTADLLNNSPGYLIENVRDEQGQATLLGLSRFVAACKRGDIELIGEARAELEIAAILASADAYSMGESVASWGQVAQAIVQVVGRDI